MVPGGQRQEAAVHPVPERHILPPTPSLALYVPALSFSKAILTFPLPFKVTETSLGEDRASPLGSAWAQPKPGCFLWTHCLGAGGSTAAQRTCPGTSGDPYLVMGRENSAVAAAPAGAELEDTPGLCSTQPHHLHRGVCRGLRMQKQCPSHTEHSAL